MFNIATLLRMLALGHVTVDRPWPKTLLRHILVLVSCLFGGVIFISAFVTTGLIWGYRRFVEEGYDPQLVAVSFAVILAAGCIVMFVIARRRVTIMMADMRFLTTRSVPITEHISTTVTEAVKGFIDGLTRRP